MSQLGHARAKWAARERFTADGLLRTQTNDHCALARIRAFASMSPIGTFETFQIGLTMSSVDGSRVARAKLTQWHWSGAVFCPAC